MEEFRFVYQRLCKDNHIEPQDCVINQAKSAEGSKKRTTLDLSTNSLSAKTCHVLGKVITTDRSFVEVKFADCMLSEDAVKALAYGFSNNVHCKKLDLKGNNIRGSGVEALGKMLRHNHCLLSVCLEWNALGMLDNSFALFCEGFGSNNSLQALDLRNNQISHDGAVELSVGLKRNCTLRALDLRWNNIGLLGGRAILEMLQTNKTLCRLELAGNNVPVDILKAIETAISQNESRALMAGEHNKKISVMTKHMQQMEFDKSLQMNDLMDTIDKQEALLRKSKQSSSSKIQQLHTTLEERKSNFNSVAAKLALTESELALTEQKANDYNMLINKLKQELSEKMRNHQEELRRFQEDRASSEAKLYKELTDCHDKIGHLETKLEDSERKCRMQQDQIFEFKEQTTHLQAEVKLKGSHFEERLQQERNRHKDDMRDSEQIKQKEMARIRQETDETEHSLRERIQKLEMSRLELEEEISRLKNNNISSKLQQEEQLNIAKQKLLSEEDIRQQQLEDKVKQERTLRDELQSRCSSQTAHISELQSKNSSLVLELEVQKRRVDELNEDLAEKNSTVLSEIGKVKIELNQTHNKLDAERKLQAELRERLGETDRKMSEQLLKNRQQIEERDMEIDDLKKRLKSRELELANVREEEGQRAQMLQLAVMNYIGKVPH